MRVTIFAVVTTCAGAAIVETGAKNINVDVARMKAINVPVAPTISTPDMCAIDGAAWQASVTNALQWCNNTWGTYESEVNAYVSSSQAYLCTGSRSSLMETASANAVPTKVPSLLQTATSANSPGAPLTSYGQGCVLQDQNDQDWIAYQSTVSDFCNTASGTANTMGTEITTAATAYADYSTANSCGWATFQATCADYSYVSGDGSVNLCICGDAGCTTNDPGGTTTYALDVNECCLPVRD